MISSLVLSILLSYSVSQVPNNTFYEFGANLTYQSGPQTMVFRAVNDTAYYVNNDIQLTCSVSYDDSDNYYLNNFNIYVTSNIYYVRGSYYGYDTIFDGNLTYSLPLDWEITPSSYVQQLSKVKFLIGVDSEDILYIKYYYDNVYQGISERELEDVIGGSNEVTYTFNEQTFFNSLSSYLSLNNSLEVYDEAYAEGFEAGNVSGYAEGYAEGFNSDSTIFTIFNGILNVALVPINVFLRIFNFEILGINISSMVSAILSICVLIIVIRMVTGKKSEGE